MHAPVCTLYTLAVQSALAVTNLVPVVLKHISKTSSTCPLKVSTHFPEPISQILQVLYFLIFIKKYIYIYICIIK